MAQFPALPLWTDAYLGDTTHLTTIEHGAYLLLLMAAWRSKECCLPNDDKMLARYSRLTPSQWKRIKPVIMGFFDVENDTIIQRRLRDEITFVKQKSKSQSDKAKARWLKTKETPDAVASSGHSKCITPTPTPTPTPNTEESIIEKPDEIETRFKEWYSLYPKKTGPEDALKAYTIEVKKNKATHEELLGGLKNYCEEIKRDCTERRFIKGPGAWIRAGRYKDEYTEIIHKGSSGSSSRAPYGGGNIIEAGNRYLDKKQRERDERDGQQLRIPE